MQNGDAAPSEVGIKPLDRSAIKRHANEPLLGGAVHLGHVADRSLQGLLREPTRALEQMRVNPLTRENFRQLDRSYSSVVAIGAVFTLARFGEAFLVLRAQQSWMRVAWVPLVMVAMNVVHSLSAYPFGKPSDRMSRRALLAIGLAILIVADLVLASSQHWGNVLLGVSLWGLHMGMTQGLLGTMVTDAAPAHLRGTAFGFSNPMSGLALFVVSVLADLLWDGLGASATFVAGAVFCGLTLAGLRLAPVVVART